MSDSRPNVILIMADQLRADSLGCYGNQVVETEFIDFLASDVLYLKMHTLRLLPAFLQEPV